MPNKQMQLIIAQLRDAPRNLDQNMAVELAKTARPFAPLVRAAILNIPVKGLVPYKQPPGLRLRIAKTVTPFATITPGLVVIGLKIQPNKMPSGQYSLPLGMQGAKRWRHPVFGNREVWVAQGNAPHPYFYEVMTPLGPASRRAIERALENLSRQISGAG